MRSVAESHVFWYGDNLQVMREHLNKDEFVDLIYLDPPFNSQREYSRFFTESDGKPADAQRKAFEDYWTWGPEAERAYDDVVNPGKRRAYVPPALSHTLELLKTILRQSDMLAYLSMMAVRVAEMRRLLKPTGSIYLHCDPTASHYLKLILDAAFGPANFQNEIIWRRTGAHTAPKSLGRIHDIILRYSKTDESFFAPQKRSYMRRHVEERYIITEDGRTKFKPWRLGNVMTGPGATSGESGAKWRGFDPSKKNRHWAIPGFLADQMPPDFASKGVLERLDALLKAGLIEINPGAAWPVPVRYLSEGDGDFLADIWAYQPYTEGTVQGTDSGIDSDVAWLGPGAAERVGYPTQKPIGLLERIIKLSCPDGGMVLDPFCGCGTAVVAAQRLNRNWIGIDVTHVAVSVLKKRLEAEFPGLVYRVRGEPEDVASARRLADERWEEFQAWFVDKVGGLPLNPTDEKKVAKKGKDGGIDGVLLFRDDPKAVRSKRMIMSVKAGKQLNPEMVDALHGVVSREGAAAGVLLTAHRPTPGMYNTARAYGAYTSEVFEPGRKYPKIQIVTVEDIFDGRWRRLDFPGANTSLKSEPPPGTPGASEELFKPPRKGTTEPLKLTPSEPAKTRPKQAKLKLKVPGSKGK